MEVLAAISKWVVVGTELIVRLWNVQVVVGVSAEAGAA
jgi:hypothetical protein